MKIETLCVAASIEGSPAEVFDTLTSSRRHSELTGADSTIEKRVGGRFSHFGGALSGAFEELTPNRRIVQRLRAADWPAHHEARVTYELSPREDGRRTRLEVLEEGVPEEKLDEVVRGWHEVLESFTVYFREQRVDVVRRFVEEYKNRQNPNIVDDLVANDCIVHIPLPGLPQGREGMRVNGRLMCGAFPDVRVTREFFVTEGDIVIERARAKATHTGELMGLPATGRKVTWTELHAYRVRGEQITEVWSEADFMGVMVQIGAVSLPQG